MSIPQRTSRRAATVFQVAVSALLFGLFFLHLWLCVDPRLLYYQQFPVFLTGFDFLERFLYHPGGLTAYVLEFLSQFTYYGWPGAAVLTVVAWLIRVFTRSLLRAASGNRSHPAAAFFPVVLLLMMYGLYEYHPGMSIALLTALVFVNLYVRAAPRSVLIRSVVFLILSVVVFHLAGGAVVLYGALCGIVEIRRARRTVLGVSCLLWGLVVPLAFAMYSYEMDMSGAYSPLQPFRGGFAFSLSALSALPVVLHLTLVLFFPVAAALSGNRRLIALRRAIGRRLAAWWRDVRGREPETSTETGEPARAAWTLSSLCLFLVVAGLLTFLSFNRGVKTRLQLGCHAERGEWALVLETARRLPSRRYDLIARHDVNRALFHTGRLPYEMFTYPQRRGVDTLLLSPFRGRPIDSTCLKTSALLFELGLVVPAQRASHVALETYGEVPEIMKRLIRINVLRGRPGVARVFLGALSRNPLCRKWAQDYRKRLDEDPLMKSDAQLRHVRSLMLTSDYGWAGVRKEGQNEERLKQLLDKNGKNRMAFEYLMAHYLLTGQMHKIVDNIGRLNGFDYRGIPRCYEEAIVLYESSGTGRKMDLHGRHVSSETRRRFRDYARLFVPYHVARGAGKRAAFETLTRKMGDTYFFYYTMGFSARRVTSGRADGTTGKAK